ncbi:hypothetical protein H8S37_04695 [Mediterraneibacter sp. NSJ-55]|uniref:Uncharacterized protein n=1 Tax=Mediterraneibacter hominis TaxID=2763054 RepID=A0A923LHH0_9FIRM|nr:hypothetical protein [Mediterraneibacter hominis]MBC5688227.1 hypothetical protein [Mediterraneibacter hominis]
MKDINKNIQSCIDDYNKKMTSLVYDDPVGVLSQQEYEKYEKIYLEKRREKLRSHGLHV